MIEPANLQNNIIKLHEVPSNCDFNCLKTALEKKLDECNSVVKIEYNKKKDGSYNLVFAHLKNSQSVEILLCAKFVEIQCYSQMHKIVITKPRSYSVSGEDGQSLLLIHEFNQEESEKRFSLFCTNIPFRMRNKPFLRNHFERFGSVKKLYLDKKESKFAFIDFFDHNSAQAAVDSKGQLKHSNERLKIEWNRGKKFEKTEKNGEDTINKMVNWNQILLKHKDFFIENLERSLLVQNLPENITTQEISLYFESNFETAKVEKLFLLPDGILVLFEDPLIISHILKVKEHFLKSNKLHLFRKPIPSIYQDRFLIQGNFEDNHTVKNLLECCQMNDDFKLEYHIKNYLYLVKFPFDVDLEKYQTAINELNLENIHPQVHHLCRTDCIMVKGISSDVNNNLIKLTFMNKNKTGGGNVTKIDRKHDHTSTLIYFADYQDAESVVEKSKSDVIYVGHDKVRVSLWHNHAHSFNQKSQITKKFPPLKKSFTQLHYFQHVLSCDSDIIEFLHQHPRSFEHFKNKFLDLALVNFSFSKQMHSPVIRFMPVNKKYVEKKVEQEKFETTCLQVLRDSLACYSTQNVSLNKERTASLRKSYLWNENCGLVQVPVPPDVFVPIFIRWNHDGGRKVKLAGKTDEVSAAVEWLKKSTNIVEKKIRLSSEELQIMEELGIFHELKKSFLDKVQIVLNKVPGEIVCTGEYDHVEHATQEVKTRLKNVIISDFESLDFYKREFLQQMFKENDEKSKKFSQQIRHLLDSRKSKVLFTPEFQMVHERSAKDPGQVLCDVIKTERVEMDGKLRVMSETSEWKRLEQQVHSKDVRLYKDFNKSRVILVGLEDSVIKSIRLISKHICNNAPEERIIDVSYLVAAFIQTFPKVSNAELKLASLSWKLTTEGGGGIQLKGNRKSVASATSWLRSFKVVSAQHVVSEPGMSLYFRGDQGHQFLETLQTLTTCKIWLDSLPSWSDQVAGRIAASSLEPTGSLQTGKVIARSQVPGKDVEIFVIQNDVTEQHCDAIVNFWNKSLSNESGTVLKRVLKTGDQFIAKHVEEVVSGRLPISSAVSILTRDLPCKKVVLVHEPLWNQSAKVLSSIKQSVNSILCECDRFGLESVSIPVFRCDEALMKKSVSALVRAIAEYLRTRPSFVNKVYLAEKDNLSVLNELKKQVLELNAPQQCHNDLLMSDEVVPGNVRANSTLESSFDRSLKVTLIKGDIAQSSADVIVTSCAPGNFRSCCGSATAKALLARAGPDLKAYLQKPEIFHVLIEGHSVANEAVLSKAIDKCLQMAEDKGYSRIAFPALGAGGMKYPSDFLARTFKQKSEEFRASNLKNLDVILHPNDTATIQAFESLFKPSSGFCSNSIRKLPLVKQGDVLETSCDALLIPTSIDFNWSGGCQLWKRAVQKAGPDISRQLNNPIYRSSDDRFRVTAGGRLRCSSIVFMRICRSASELSSTLQSVLLWLEEQGIRSLALPTLTTANSSLKATDVADILAREIHTFVANSHTNLSRIELVVLDPTLLARFHSAVNSYFVEENTQRHPVTTSSVPNNMASIIPRQAPVQMLTLHICSVDEEKIEEAKRRIQQQIKEKSSERRISNEALTGLSPVDEGEIMKLAQTHDVALRKETTSGSNFCLVVSGLKDEVYNVCDAINCFIQELREALSQAKFVLWKYKNQNTSQIWHFPVRASFKIEASYKKNPQGSARLEVPLATHKQTVVIDFSSMSMMNQDTGTTSMLVRSLKTETDVLPSHWECMKGLQWKKVQVSPSSDEYQRVMNIFKSSGFSRRVVQLERIQNPTLYKQFVAQKLKVEKRMGNQTAPVSRELFHGTSADVCANIYKDGFDRSHCGKNATSFGKGVYFATTATYSEGYTNPDARGMRCMFLADVITGEFCQGSSDLRVPPLKPHSSSDRYDSVVNHVNSPTMFVVFKDASVYPAYVLTYGQ